MPRSKVIIRAFYLCLSLLVFLLFLISIVAPLVFRWSPGIMKSFIFVPDQEIPENVDYQHPESLGFVGGRNFYLTTKDGATIGVWHTLPPRLGNEAKNLNGTDSEELRRTYDDWLSDATVFMYLHGSAGTRTSHHRLRLYYLLNHMNFHVIAFDYRGYGDSTSYPSGEKDLVEDATTVFSWIRERVVTGRIFMWGHSLGTGVAAHLADNLTARGEQIKGVVLEAPFNNMAGAVMANSLAKTVSFLPWFHYCFIDPLYKNDMSFESDEHLKQTPVPVLILHAKDDRIVPFRLAAKLYESVKASRNDSNTIQMISYDSDLHYGHYNITKDPNLNPTIRQFVDSVL